MASSIDPALKELQKAIAGQRDHLEPIEIKHLFDLPVSQEFNVTLLQALKTRNIDVDVALLQIVPRATTRDYLIPIALCIRYGANSNMYVDVPNVGQIHLLGYVYYVLYSTLEEMGDMSILTGIVLMLIYKGARLTLPVFDARGGKIRDADDTITNSESVLEWLDRQGYNTDIIDRVGASGLASVVDANTVALFAILLDDPTVLGSVLLEARHIPLAIRAFAERIFDSLPLLEVVAPMMDVHALTESVTYFNANAFEALLKQGMLPSYVLMNNIIVQMKSYQEREHLIVVGELNKMLLAAINVGVEMDPNQMDIIGTMGAGILDAVVRAYEQPYWKKACRSGSRMVPERLRRLALSLNLDPSLSRRAICERITQLSRAEPGALKEAARRRQQLRMSTELGTVAEFIGGKTPPLLMAQNRSLFQPNDPMVYNDYDIAWYRDDQGAVWCFPSRAFERLAERGINPHSYAKLPVSFLELLNYKIAMLQRLGLRGRFASALDTFPKAVDSLMVPDTVTAHPGEELVRQFVALAAAHGVSDEIISGLTRDQLLAALRTIQYDPDLSSLSTDHALLTVAHVIAYLKDAAPEVIPDFFAGLKRNLG